ncbi:MAG: hypothetical protein A2W11_03725 [Ignavibacteria bacterium RBG_16_35_7]|nr:MAG: hypothetical protein A2W11_03725 [Ignavibacteria bacterium RBG_16_35_7]
MARQEVELAISLTKYPNKTLEGYYLGHKIITGTYKEQLIHKIQKPDGKKIQVYGFTSLNIHLEQVEPGTYVWITYIGKSSEKNKYGNQVHICRVEYDFEKKLDLPKVDADPEGTPDAGQNDDIPF